MIDIHVDGSSIRDHVLWAQTTFSGVADGNPGQASVVLDNSDRSFTPSDLHAGMTLELFIDGSRQWDGWVMGLDRTWPFAVEDTQTPNTAPRFWRLTGADRNLFFGKRVMFHTDDPSSNQGFVIWPAGTPDKTAIEYALDHYVDLTGDDLTFDIREIDSPSPSEEFTIGYTSAPMGVLFEDCSKMTGGVYWIGPERRLHYRSDRIVTAPFILSDAPTGAQVGYREATITDDYSDPATQGLVWGGGMGSALPVFAKYTEDDARQTYGLWQWGDLFVGASEQATAMRRARTYVIGSPHHRQGHDEPVPVVKCVLFETGIKAGHVVDFRSTLYDYQSDLPVRKVDISFPTPDEAKFSLEMSLKVDTPFGTPDPWWLKRVGNERDQVVIDQVGGGTTGDLLIDHFDTDYGNFYSKGSSQHQYTPIGESLWTISISFASRPLEIGDTVLVHNLLQYATSPPTALQEELDFEMGDNWGFETDPAALNTSGARFMRWHRRIIDGTEPYYPTGQIDVMVNDVYMGWAFVDVVKGAIHPSWMVAFSNTANPPSLATNGSYPTTNSALYYASAWATGSITTNPSTFLTRQNFTTSTPAAFRSRVSGKLGTNVTTDPSSFGGSTYVMTSHLRILSPYDTAEGPLLVTPGPEVTGAPWEGGNVYEGQVNGTPTEVIVVDSTMYASSKHAELYDTGISLSDTSGYPFGSIVPPSPGMGNYPWSGWSTSHISGGVMPDALDLLVKWRYTGGPVNGLLNIRWLAYSLPPGGGETDVWMTQLGFYIGRRPEILMGVSTVSWLCPPVYPEVPGYGMSNIRAMPYHAYVWPGEYDLQPDTWYYSRLKASGPSGWGWPYVDFGSTDGTDMAAVGMEFAMMRTWPVGNDEPTAGASQQFFWYWEGSLDSNWPGTSPVPPDELQATASDGWDVWLPVAWSQNSDGLPPPDATAIAYTMTNELEIFSANTVGDERFEIDAIWRYGGGSTALPGYGSTVREIPNYIETDETGAGVYVTSFPYEAGSLVLYLQGVRLREGIDYVEVDPQDGTFRLLGLGDVANDLQVVYERSGVVANLTGAGTVYRPAGQMQFGWGTALDGYNCTFAASAMALDRHTLGTYTAFRGTPRNTPPNHRSFQDDQVGGGDVFDAALAWQNGWGQTMHTVGTLTWDAFVNELNEGRGAILQGDYQKMPADKRVGNTSLGHTIYVNEQFGNGNFWGYDPLYRYPLIYTPAELQYYAEGYISPGMVSAGFTQVTT